MTADNEPRYPNGLTETEHAASLESDADYRDAIEGMAARGIPYLLVGAVEPEPDADPFDGTPLFPCPERDGAASDSIAGLNLGGASVRPAALRAVLQMGERRYGYGFTGGGVSHE